MSLLPAERDAQLHLGADRADVAACCDLYPDLFEKLSVCVCELPLDAVAEYGAPVELWRWLLRKADSWEPTSFRGARRRTATDRCC